MDFNDDRYEENFSENCRRDSQPPSEESLSRDENRLLWELYDSVYPEAMKVGIPVDWVDDSFETVVIGHYEVSQGVFGSHDFKCLSIIPHGSGDLGKFGLYYEDTEQGMAFFESHFNYLEAQKNIVTA
jgi:hypothetical protein